MSSPRRARRPWRGGVLAVLTVLLTALGHLAGGGALPDLAVLLVLFPLVAGLFVALAGRRGVVGTVTTLAVGQLVLHQLMELLHVGHTAAGPSGGRMLGAHAVVTVVLAVALRHADAAVDAIAAVVRRVVPRRISPPPPDRPLPVCAVPAPDLPARLARALSVAHVRRGPPVCVPIPL